LYDAFSADIRHGSRGGSSSSSATAVDEGFSFRSCPEDLQHEIQQCERNIIRTQAETLAAEGRAQEAEEIHQQELAVFCAQLDALERHLLAEHNQQTEEKNAAQYLLESARAQMGEMRDELRFSQEEAERIESEARYGRPQLDVLSAQLEQDLRYEEAAEAEVDALRRAADDLRDSLAAQCLERTNLSEHRRYLEEALERASSQIESFESWSEGVRSELQQVASELHEDQAAGEVERAQLQAKAAGLARHLPGHEAWSTRQQAEASRAPQHSVAADALLVQSPMAHTQSRITASPPSHITASPLHAGQTGTPRQSPIVMSVQPPTCETPVAMKFGSPRLHVDHDASRGLLGTPNRAAEVQSMDATLLSSPTVLWCRKAPSQNCMQASPAPALV
jgi:chromosome segregation ATPase